MSDRRIVYGANCCWWDSVDKISTLKGYSGSTLPCCPFCKSVLYEVPNIEEWEAGAKKYEKNGHPGYLKLLLWMRGKHFKTMEEAKTALANEQKDRP